MAEKIKNDLFSVQEAAEFLGISKSTIYRYISVRFFRERIARHALDA